jgi:hypothetical protein
MKTSSLLLMAAVAALVVQSADAQVRQLQTGQTLDANYQMGSGGYNTVNGGQGGVNSQLYVNGQVTGLGSFHGRVPYGTVGALRMDVPSAGFDTFMRQSVGAQDAMTSQVYQTTPYIPSTAVPQLQNFARGDIGSMGYRRQYDSGAQSLYIDATADYQPLISSSPMRSSANGRANQDTLLVAPTSDAGGTNYPGAFASPLFGAPSSVRDALAKEFRQMDARADKAVDASVDASVDGRAKGDKLPDLNDPGKGTNDLSSKDPNSKEPSANRPGTTDTPRRDIARPPTKTTNDPNGGVAGRDREGVLRPRANQDVFMDLLVNLQARRNTVTDPAITAPLPKLEKPDTGRPADGETPVRTGKRVVEMGQDRTILLHGLAGTGNDMFNSQMKKAQSKLLAGRYYDSAGDFETACVIDMANPLARLGAGLAIFGAGEPFSAALHVRRGLQVFPPIMETRLDLKGMMDTKVFDAQLTELDNRLAGDDKDSAELLLLGTYLHYAVGQDKEAQACAQRLKVLTKDDRLIQSYAEFVLTGKRPAYQKDAAGK